MSRFLLDTNVISEFNKTGQPDERVRQWLDDAAPDSLYISVIILAEIRFGIELLPLSKRRTQLEQWMEHEFPGWFPGRILPVDEDIVKCWAVLTAKRQRMGQPIASLDGLIAATAFHHGLTLVTRDVNDFRGVGVTLINPWEERNLTLHRPDVKETEQERQPDDGKDFDR